MNSEIILDNGYEAYFDEEDSDIRVEGSGNLGTEYMYFTKEDLLDMLKLLEEGVVPNNITF